MVEGRTHRPVIDRDVCRTCGVCVRGCPAEWIDEYRKEADSLRGAAYRDRAGRYRRDGQVVPPCGQACPAGLETARYAGLIAKGMFREALEVIREAIPFPRTVGLVCNHPCESACVLGQCMDEPVALCALKAFVAGLVDLPANRREVKKTGRRAAVIGAGPAGLTCAHALALCGHDVTVYEALPEPGGMARYAIPDYRLPKAELKTEIDAILTLGVDLMCGVRVGEDIGLEEVAGRHDAVFIGTGAPLGVPLGIPGEDAPGVMDGIAFLRSVESGEPPAVGKRVAVIGRGNTAVDCARTARSLGAFDVSVVYRRSAEEMPALRDEIAALASDGVTLQFLAAPVKVIAGDGGLREIECVRIEATELDTRGDRLIVPIEGSRFRVPADTVITALGQAPDAAFTHGLAIPLSTGGTIRIDADGATGRRGVFAGGDVATGPLYVIDAIAAGRRAAASMDRYMRGEGG